MGRERKQANDDTETEKTKQEPRPVGRWRTEDQLGPCLGVRGGRGTRRGGNPVWCRCLSRVQTSTAWKGILKIHVLRKAANEAEKEKRGCLVQCQQRRRPAEFGMGEGKDGRHLGRMNTCGCQDGLEKRAVEGIACCCRPGTCDTQQRCCREDQTLRGRSWGQEPCIWRGQRRHCQFCA